MPETISTQLARFIVNLKFEDLPKPIVDKAKIQILDVLGVALATSTLPWCNTVYSYVKNFDASGKATVVNYGLRTNPELAALANATFAHGFEMDDWGSYSHPGCVAVPTALALAEETGATGRDLILTTVIGDDIIQRVGLAAGISFAERGMHITGSEGVFGSAAVAAKLLGMSETQTTHALGLAASHAAGVAEFAVSGGEVKRYHAGMGASGGIRSAMLARSGLTAPPTAIEGKRGVFQALANSYDLSKLTDGLGKDFQISKLAFKIYSAPADMHPHLEVMATLKQKYGLTAKDIESIEVGLHKGGLWHIGSVGPRPGTPSEAQFSIHFGLALVIVKGSNSFATLKEQMDGGFSDPGVIAVAEKVHPVLDEETDRVFPGVRRSRITVHTKDGRTLTEVGIGCKGMPDRPITKQDLEDKFRGMAGTILPRAKVEEIINTVQELEKLTGIGRLTRRLVI